MENMQAEILKELREIRLLIQRMPEIMAVAIMLEKEKYSEASLFGKSYSDTVAIPPPELR